MRYPGYNKVKGRPRNKRGMMNKTEAEYAMLLEISKREGTILHYDFEKIKFKLADNTYFEVDFYVITKDLVLELHECKSAWKQKDGSYKAHWEDDARVKIKVAAEQFPYFQFIGACKFPHAWAREFF